MRFYFISIFTILHCFHLISQDFKKWEINGYISTLAAYKAEKADTLLIPKGKNNHKDVLLHNRFNFFYYPNASIESSLQIRNRFIWDETFENTPGIIENYANDNGLMQLSTNLYDNKNVLLNSSIDRLYFMYTLNKFQITIGRQRINWSQSFAWNPNDILNTSNYFDFDYAEKPGSDAIRLQYFTGMASSVEAVVKLDHLKNITLAGLYRSTVKGYDIQGLAGIYNEEEMVLGLGWSGYILQAGFRGEITGLIPYKDTSEYAHEMTNALLATLSFDYSFKNSAHIMLEMLYSNSKAGDVPTNGFTSFLGGPLTIRNLGFAAFSSLASFTYPIHPLINMSLSSMLFYKVNGIYAGPNFDFSLSDNLSLALFWQYFRMFVANESSFIQEDISINYLFCRLKYNF